MNREIKAMPKIAVVDPLVIPHVLGEGELGCVLEYFVRDKNGNTHDHVVKESESYVQQFLEMLYLLMNMSPSSAPVSIRDTLNTLRDTYMPFKNGAGAGYVSDVLAGAGDVTFGTVVGTGNTAPVITNYVMETLIAHGVGGGQLQYSVVTFGAPASDATTSQLTITRNFANGSGGAITVNEIGLYARVFDGAARYIMLIRDVIGGGIAVPNGQTLTTNYRPQATI